MARCQTPEAKATLQIAKEADLAYLAAKEPYGKAMERWNAYSFHPQLDGKPNREKITHVMMLTRNPQTAEDARSALSSIATGTQGILSKMSTIPASIVKWSTLDGGRKSEAQKTLITEATAILNTKVPITPRDPQDPVFTAKAGDTRPFVKEQDTHGNDQFYVRYSALGRDQNFQHIDSFNEGAEEVIKGAWDRTEQLKGKMESAFSAIGAQVAKQVRAGAQHVTHNFEQMGTQVATQVRAGAQQFTNNFEHIGAQAATQVRAGAQHVTNNFEQIGAQVARQVQANAQQLTKKVGKVFVDRKEQFTGAALRRSSRSGFTPSPNSAASHTASPAAATSKPRVQHVGINQVPLDALRSARLSSPAQAYEGQHLHDDGRLQGFFTESKTDFTLGPVIDYCQNTPREKQTVQGLFDYKVSHGHLNSAYRLAGNESQMPPRGVQVADLQGNVGQAYAQALALIQGRLDHASASH
jgi:hypothetical protein